MTPMWLIINRASSPTVTKPSYWQCDSPTWSHTAFLSRFHARCRSPFWLHRRQSRLLGGSPVERLQSHMILTMSHWSSGLTCLLPATRVTGSNPLGGLMWNRDSPVSVVSLQYLKKRQAVSEASSVGLVKYQLAMCRAFWSHENCCYCAVLDHLAIPSWPKCCKSPGIQYRRPQRVFNRLSLLSISCLSRVQLL